MAYLQQLQECWTVAVVVSAIVVIVIVENLFASLQACHLHRYLVQVAARAKKGEISFVLERPAQLKKQKNKGM